MSKAKVVVVIGSDSHAYAIRSALMARGADVYLIDTAFSSYTIKGSASDCLRLRIREAHVDLSIENVDSVYWRSYDGTPEFDLEVEYLNFKSLFESWLWQLTSHDNVRAYNDFDAWLLHKRKPLQMDAMHNRATGFGTVHVPDVIYGIDWQNYCRKDPQGGNAAIAPGESWKQEVVSSQRSLDGPTIRMYVWPGEDNDSVSYEVKSRYYDYRQERSCEVTIPDDPVPAIVVSEVCQMVDFLRWNWAGVDLMYDHGKWALIDVNPSPMFLGFERQSGIVTEKLVSHLIGENA